MKNKYLIKFLENTNSIPESDYGDFMRKENLYFQQLREELGQNIPEEAAERLSAMQGYLQYNPDWDVEHTRHEIVEDTNELDLLLDINPGDMMQNNSALDFHSRLHHP